MSENFPREIGDRLARQELFVQSNREIVMSSEAFDNAWKSAMDGGRQSGEINYSMPLRRFGQLVDTLRRRQELQKPKRQTWVFPLCTISEESTNLQYIIDLRTSQVSVAEQTDSGIKLQRPANSTDIQEDLPFAVFNLVSGVTGRSPAQLKAHMEAINQLTKVVAKFERDQKSNQGPK